MKRPALTDYPCRTCGHARRYHTATNLMGEVMRRDGCTACARCSYYTALPPERKVISSKVKAHGRIRYLKLSCGHIGFQNGRIYPPKVTARCKECIPQEERYDTRREP